MNKFLILPIVASFVAISAPSYASVQSVTAGCAAGGNCLALMQQEIAALKAQGISGAQLNQAIANLVVSVSQTANTGNSAAISQAVSFAATQSTDPGQAGAINSIAQTIALGGTVSQNQTAGIGNGGPNANGNNGNANGIGNGNGGGNGNGNNGNGNGGSQGSGN